MKRYVCVDIEMSELTYEEKRLVPGLQREVIQIGAVMLDENYNKISSFSTFVKPSFSHVTKKIEELTGIKEENLENADDFITAFDKYCYWIGDSNITTFCWSAMDYTQMWNELYSKAKHRTDLFEYLETFVDLQKSFCDVIKAKKPVSLDSAVTLINEDFLGQHHTADSDAYNTGCILHKLCCTEGLEPQFNFLNIGAQEEEKKAKEKKSKEYQNSFAAFMSPELLKLYGYVTENEETEEEYEDDDDCFYHFTGKNSNNSKEENILAPQSPEEEICQKYKIPLEEFNSFAEKIKTTGTMEEVA